MKTVCECERTINSYRVSDQQQQQKLINMREKMGKCVGLTDNVGQGECLAEKVAIGPPVVMF